MLARVAGFGKSAMSRRMVLSCPPMMIQKKRSPGCMRSAMFAPSAMFAEWVAASDRSPLLGGGRGRLPIYSRRLGLVE